MRRCCARLLWRPATRQSKSERAQGAAVRRASSLYLERIVKNPAQPSHSAEATDHEHHAHARHHHHGHGAHAATQPAVARAPKGASSAKEVEYTCPMHPQIRQMGPGSCPICGMALEPVVATADTGE